MNYTAKYITPDSKLSCYEDKFFKSDISFDEHMLVWFISCETKIVQADETFVFSTGDIFLIPRNELATILNYPTGEQPHKTVFMHLTTEKLREYYAGTDEKTKAPFSRNIRRLGNHSLLVSCLSSLFSKQSFVTIALTEPDKYILQEKNPLKRKLLQANANSYGSPIHISTNTQKTDHKGLVKILSKEFELYKDKAGS